MERHLSILGNAHCGSGRKPTPITILAPYMAHQVAPSPADLLFLRVKTSSLTAIEVRFSIPGTGEIA
jgi:hypothetical protein